MRRRSEAAAVLIRGNIRLRPRNVEPPPVPTALGGVARDARPDLLALPVAEVQRLRKLLRRLPAMLAALSFIRCGNGQRRAERNDRRCQDQFPLHSKSPFLTLISCCDGLKRGATRLHIVESRA